MKFLCYGATVGYRGDNSCTKAVCDLVLGQLRKGGAYVCRRSRNELSLGPRKEFRAAQGVGNEVMT